MSGSVLVGPGVDDDTRVRPLEGLVEGWLREGVISPDQAAAMLGGPSGSALLRRGPRARRTPLVAEALAYVGAAVLVAGATLLVARSWADLAGGWRLACLAAVALALLVGGAAVPQRRSGVVARRLRSVLWAASTGAWAGALAVLVHDVLATTGMTTATEAVLVAAGTVAWAAVLWARLRYGVQQTVLALSLAALAGAVVAWTGSALEPGVGVWLVGLVWAGLGRAGVLRPLRTPVVLGSALAVFGAMTTATSDAGMVLTLATVVAVVASAVLTRDLLLLGVGAVGTLVNVPAAATRWTSGSLGAALALLGVGGVLVALAVWMTRWAAPGPPSRRWEESDGG